MNLRPGPLFFHTACDPARVEAHPPTAVTATASVATGPDVATSWTARTLPILPAFARDFPSTVRTSNVSLVRFHRLVTTALALGLAALAAWRGESFLTGGGWTDLAVALLAAPAAVGLVVYLFRLNSVFSREPGPGTPRDAGD